MFGRAAIRLGIGPHSSSSSFFSSPNLSRRRLYVYLTSAHGVVLVMVALWNRADHYIFMLWFVTVARDSGRLLYFGRVIFYFFSVHQIFAVPGPIFTKLYHTTRYVLK